MDKKTAAALIRKAFKKAGCDPRGKVYSRRSDYFDHLVIELRHLTEDARSTVECAISEIPRDINFTFEIE
jgi:hypothetical protein